MKKCTHENTTIWLATKCVLWCLRFTQRSRPLLCKISSMDEKWHDCNIATLLLGNLKPLDNKLGLPTPCFFKRLFFPSYSSYSTLFQAILSSLVHFSTIVYFGLYHPLTLVIACQLYFTWLRIKKKKAQEFPQVLHFVVFQVHNITQHYDLLIVEPKMINRNSSLERLAVYLYGTHDNLHYPPQKCCIICYLFYGMIPMMLTTTFPKQT